MQRVPAVLLALAAVSIGVVIVMLASRHDAGDRASAEFTGGMSGVRDSLGYLLPLDVKRPHPQSRREIGTRGPRPARAPGSAPVFPALFEEHRLGPDDGHTQNETSIAAHGDTLVAGWNNYTGTTLVMGVARSIDGGHTWTNAILGGHDVTSDPAVRAGGNGRWYYAYIASGGAGGTDMDVYVKRSLDAGATWLGPAAVTANGTFDDKPYIDARGNEVLAGWADFAFSPAKVRAARSLDGGLTFGAHSIVSVRSASGNGAAPVIAVDGTYYLFWRDSFQDSLWVAKSLDDGITWSPDRGIVDMHPLPTPLPGGFRMVNLPSADASPSTGTLIVVWNDQRFGNPDILSIRSTDGGSTWSPPIRVNDDAGTAQQFFPWIAFDETGDETGIAHVVWYDRRTNGFDIDVYCARSMDDGISWEPNVRVTAAPFTPVLPWDTSLDFIGDYNGIAASNGVAYPFYQDARTGDQDVYVALVSSGSSSVASAPGGSAGGPGRVNAAPNPFVEATRIHITGGAGGVGEIVDAAGRRVRTLQLHGDGVATWDGHDDGGRDLAAGVYFARVAGDHSPGVRIVRMR